MDWQFLVPQVLPSRFVRWASKK